MVRTDHVGRVAILAAFAALVLAVPAAHAGPRVFIQIGAPVPVAPVVVAPRVIPPPVRIRDGVASGILQLDRLPLCDGSWRVGAAALCTRGLDRAAVGARATRRVLGTRVLAALGRYRAPRPERGCELVRLSWPRCAVCLRYNPQWRA